MPPSKSIADRLGEIDNIYHLRYVNAYYVYYVCYSYSDEYIILEYYNITFTLIIITLPYLLSHYSTPHLFR